MTLQTTKNKKGGLVTIRNVFQTQALLHHVFLYCDVATRVRASRVCRGFGPSHSSSAIWRHVDFTNYEGPWDLHLFKYLQKASYLQNVRMPFSLFNQLTEEMLDKMAPVVELCISHLPDLLSIMMPASSKIFHGINICHSKVPPLPQTPTDPDNHQLPALQLTFSPPLTPRSKSFSILSQLNWMFCPRPLDRPHHFAPFPSAPVYRPVMVDGYSAMPCHRCPNIEFLIRGRRCGKNKRDCCPLHICSSCLFTAGNQRCSVCKRCSVCEPGKNLACGHWTCVNCTRTAAQCACSLNGHFVDSVICLPCQTSRRLHIPGFLCFRCSVPCCARCVVQCLPCNTIYCIFCSPPTEVTTSLEKAPHDPLERARRNKGIPCPVRIEHKHGCLYGCNGIFLQELPSPLPPPKKEEAENKPPQRFFLHIHPFRFRLIFWSRRERKAPTSKANEFEGFDDLDIPPQ